MNNRSTPTRTGLTLALLLSVALAAAAQQYMNSLEIGGGYGATGIDLTSAGDIDMDGDLTVGGVLTGDASGLTNVPGGAGTGDVIGPATATDNAVARYDGTSGTLLQDSAVTITDTTGVITTPGDLAFAERADHASTPGAGYGYLWVENTVPSTLVFTDDAGTDTTLGAGGGSGIDELTGDVTAGPGSGAQAATIAAGAVDIAMLSATGTPDNTTFLRGDNTWATPAGSGDVSKVGTPADGQIGVWTGDGTIEGDASLTFDTTDDTLVVAASGKVGFGAVDILSDSSGTTTLDNIDALGATTESTVEAAIDTLANLTSIQGQTVTVSGTTTLSGTNTGDVSLAGTPDYITLAGQVLTRNAVDLTADVTGALPIANGGTGATSAGDARTALGVDAAGTDNSTDVTLAGTPDYITISGQTITRGAIDLAADVTGTLPASSVGNGLTDAQVSDTLTASLLVGSGSTSGAVDLATAEVAGDLALSNIAQLSQNTIAGRAISAGTGDITGLTMLQVRTMLQTPVAITSTSNSTAWNSDNAQIFTHVTSENTTIAASSGTPFNGQVILFRIQKNSTFTLAWNAQFRAGSDFGDAIPTLGTTDDDFDYYIFIYNGTDSAFDLLAHNTGN